MPGPSRRPRYLAALASALVVALPVVAACGPGTSASEGSDNTVNVVATTTQVADFARNVGGKRVHVTQLLKPNVDPHDFEPSPADIQAISRADLVVENGLDLESWLHDTIDSAGFDGPTVDSSKGVKTRTNAQEEEHTEEEHGEHEHGEKDPHIWHSPGNAKTMAGNIERALSRADSEHRGDYRANLRRYDRKLDTLDAHIKRQLATIPKAQRKLVTDHDAFGYYLNRFGITFVGSIIPSMDSSAELSGRQMDTLVDKIKAQHVRAIFSESSLSPKTAKTIGDRAGVKVVAGENSLYGDTLGPKGSDGATYIAMMRHNTKTIVEGLHG